MTLFHDSPHPRRVIVLRALKLGDLLCAVPAFRAMRLAWPDAEIVLVGLPWAKQFVERYRCYLDDFREFPGYPGLPERPPVIERIPGFLAETQSERYDLAIQLHGSGPFVNPLSVLFGARRTAGFYLEGDYCPDRELFVQWPDDGRETDRLLRLTEFLGLTTRGEHLDFPIFAEDHETLAGLCDVEAFREPGYVCVHPGASVPERRWSPGCFAGVARALTDQGFTVLFTGSDSEKSLIDSIIRQMNRPAVNLAGQTDLGTLAALLSGARLLLCNDTGVSHLADALRLPSVVLSTGNNPAR